MSAQATIASENAQSNVVTIDTKTGEILNQPEPIEVEQKALTTPKTNAAQVLDLSSKKFLDGLKRRDENRLALIKWIDENLKEKADYGTIDVKAQNGRLLTTKPFLFKSGAEKIMAMLGLIVIFPNLTKYEEAAINGVEIKQIVLRCQLVSSSGYIVNEGVGCRHITKDKGDLNKAFKMAKKSATIDAVVSTMGLSELFTQDKEDVEEQARAEPHQHQAAVQQTETRQPNPEQQSIGKQSQLHKRIEQMILTESDVKGLNSHSFREFVKSILIAQSNGAFEHFPDVTQDWANWLINEIPALAVRHANGE